MEINVTHTKKKKKQQHKIKPKTEAKSQSLCLYGSKLSVGLNCSYSAKITYFHVVTEEAVPQGTV